MIAQTSVPAPPPQAADTEGFKRNPPVLEENLLHGGPAPVVSVVMHQAVFAGSVDAVLGCPPQLRPLRTPAK